MKRAFIENAVARIGEASESKGFRAVPMIGDALSPVAVERIMAESSICLPADYRDFLLCSNGLSIQFFQYTNWFNKAYFHPTENIDESGASCLKLSP